MRKSYILSVGTLVGSAAITALAGAGIASADNEFNGQTYADAQQAIIKSGMTSRVGAIVGDQLPTGQCMVTGSQTRQVVGSSGFTGGSEVVLNLDCNITAATPAPSQAATADAQQNQEQSQLEQQATPGQAGEGGQTGG
ncbi:MAG: hypothetical protein ACR2JM_06140 [Mycobacterium sp.]